MALIPPYKGPHWFHIPFYTRLSCLHRRERKTFLWSQHVLLTYSLLQLAKDLVTWVNDINASGTAFRGA